MYKLIVLPLLFAAASAGYLDSVSLGHAPVAVAPVAVAHAPVAVAHAPVATSYANVNLISRSAGVAVQPVAVKTIAAPIPVAVGHGGYGGLGGIGSIGSIGGIGGYGHY